MNNHHIVAMIRVDTDLRKEIKTGVSVIVCEFLLGDDIASLLHERSNGKPHCVHQRKLVHKNLKIRTVGKQQKIL